MREEEDGSVESAIGAGVLTAGWVAGLSAEAGKDVCCGMGLSLRGVLALT